MPLFREKKMPHWSGVYVTKRAFSRFVGHFRPKKENTRRAWSLVFITTRDDEFFWASYRRGTRTQVSDGTFLCRERGVLGVWVNGNGVAQGRLPRVRFPRERDYQLPFKSPALKFNRLPSKSVALKFNELPSYQNSSHADTKKTYNYYGSMGRRQDATTTTLLHNHDENNTEGN